MRRAAGEMDARIWIAGDTAGDLSALRDWLQGEDELRGRIQVIPRDIAQTELGSGVEVLSVALGTGGAGSVLASSLKT